MTTTPPRLLAEGDQIRADLTQHFPAVVAHVDTLIASTAVDPDSAEALYLLAWYGELAALVAVLRKKVPATGPALQWQTVDAAFVLAIEPISCLAATRAVGASLPWEVS